MTTTLFKVLGPDRMPCHGGRGQWPEPGKWRSVEGEVVPCLNGLHLTDAAHLPEWLGPEVWVAEAHPDATVAEQEGKVAVSRARLVRRVEAWDADMARRFAADCAERALPAFEARFPDDDRPRRAVEAARSGGRGDAADAADAAYAALAARAAADAAFAADAADAADAAYAAFAADAADAAARAAASYAAAYAAAYAAYAAFAADAADAADAAARAAASYAGERAWQAAHLMAVLGLSEDAS